MSDNKNKPLITVTKTIASFATECTDFRDWLANLWRELYFSPLVFRDPREGDPEFLTEGFRTDDLYPTPEEMVAELEGKNENYKVERDLDRQAIAENVEDVVSAMSELAPDVDPEKVNEDMGQLLDLFSDQSGRFSLMEIIGHSMWLGEQFEEIVQTPGIFAGHGDILQTLWDMDYQSYMWDGWNDYLIKSAYALVIGKPIDQWSEEDQIDLIEDHNWKIKLTEDDITISITRKAQTTREY
ncbi:MAG: hypothetical protein CMB45_05090 [Euryarchaeota archaeon]|nr:hypothetical protein [Euryarchaeota archaeon]|tara:strand:- start:12080 stop:12802 length:723 start_codon:yes stop_codon:yes gene_type:complete